MQYLPLVLGPCPLRQGVLPSAPTLLTWIGTELKMKRSTSISWLILVLLGIFLQFVAGSHVQAQQQADNSPAYLDELREPPPAKEVRRRSVQQTYPDESVRLKYEVVQLSDDTFVNDGKYTEFYRDGEKFQEGMFKNGGYEGEWTYWHPNGQVCKSITYKSSKPNGSWDVFRKDGTKSESQSYVEGKRDGKWTFYFPDGKNVSLELNYSNGVLNGKRINFYEDGKKKQEIDIKDGKMHGKFLEWDETGKKRLERNFKNGKPDGDPIWY